MNLSESGNSPSYNRGHTRFGTFSIVRIVLPIGRTPGHNLLLKEIPVFYFLNEPASCSLSN
jgi:hypothetical protein